MEYFDTDFVIEIYENIAKQIRRMGCYSDYGVRCLASVLEQIQNDDDDPSLSDKMTHLIFTCVKLRPFFCDNEATAIFLGAMFAMLNGIDLDEEYFKKMEDIVIEVLKDTMSKDELNDFIRHNCLDQAKIIQKPEK